MDADKAKKMAEMALAAMEGHGTMFRQGALETVTYAFVYELGEERIAQVIEHYTASKYLFMPWGMRVAQ